MARPTSHCMNCGHAKESGQFLADFCGDCFSAIEGAKAQATAEGTNLDAARRKALAERAHVAHRNFVDPRVIDRKTIWMTGNLLGRSLPNG